MTSLESRRTKARQTATKTKPWKFDSQISFVNKYINSYRKEKTNVAGAAEDREMDDSEEDSNDIDVKSEFIPKDSSTCLKSPQQQKTTATPTFAATVLQEYLCFKNNDEALSKNDALQKYFAGIQETVQAFPTHLHIEAKSQIFSIIQNMKYEIESGASNLS